jgi:cytochrome c5
MNTRILILPAAVLLLAACATKQVVTITETHAQQAAAKYPGATMASLTEGKTLYEGNCGKCHGLKKPNAYNEQQWGKHVARMAPKAKIDKRTENLILQYLVVVGGK